MAEADPGTLAFLRYALAMLCLLPFLIGQSFADWRRRDLAIVLAIGFLQFGLFHYLINSALISIPASRGAVIFALIPIVTMIMSAIFQTQALNARRLVAAALALLGVALALGEKAFVETATGLSDWTGELLFFSAVLCGGTYNAASGRLLSKYSTMPVTVLAMLGGVFFLFVMAVQEGLLHGPPDYSFAGWMIVLYLAVPAGAVAFFLFNWGLRRLSPAGAAIFVPVAPLTATALGAVLLGEEITGLFLVGLICVLAGIVLVNRRGAAKN